MTLGLTLTDLAIMIVVIAAVVALVWIALRQFGIAIPPWVMNVFWVVCVAFVVILAIKLVAGMW